MRRALWFLVPMTAGGCVTVNSPLWTPTAPLVISQGQARACPMAGVPGKVSYGLPEPTPIEGPVRVPDLSPPAPLAEPEGQGQDRPTSSGGGGRGATRGYAGR